MISIPLVSLCILPLTVPTGAGDSLFKDLSVYDALANARRSNQVVLVSWTREEDPICKRMERTWENPEVIDWVQRNAIAVQVDGYKDQRQARNWDVNSLPAVLLIKPDGVVFLRATGFQTVDALLVEFDAAVKAMRAGTEAAIERPSGDSASDPQVWLDYANALFANSNTNAGECLEAYLWCLDNGDVQSPGFLDKYLDLILRRVVSLDKLAPAKAGLNKRRNGYAKALDEGFGTPGSVRILMSLCQHLGEPQGALGAFEAIWKGTDPDPAMLETALNGVLEQLIGKKRYKDALDAAGDVVAKARTVASELNAGIGERSAGTFNAQLKDARREFVDRSGYYYEALLAVGRGADAKELAEVVLELVPTGSAYSTFIGHAKRAGVRKVAEQLCAAGVEAVDSEKGKKMIERALKAVKPGFKRIGKSARDVDAQQPGDE